MNFHEYQAKELFAQYGIAVPPGKVAKSADAAVDAAKHLGGSQWMVKARSTQAVAASRRREVLQELGRSPCCRQAHARQQHGNLPVRRRALPVNLVLVTDATNIAKSCTCRSWSTVTARPSPSSPPSMAAWTSSRWAKETPEDIHTIVVDFIEGLQPYQCRQLGFAMDLNPKQVSQLTKIMLGLYKLFNEKDLSLVELNPLAILEDGNLAALDGKVNSDDNAEFRHADLAAMRDLTQEDAAEAAAVQHNLNYVTMDGSIGCMVNGAGLPWPPWT